MDPVFQSLKIDIASKEAALKTAKALLVEMERNCAHQWMPVEYCPEQRGGYTIPGDPPEMMGVDWRGPVHVEPETVRKWRRVCRVCGKIEETTRSVSDPHPKEIPQF